MKKTLLLMLVVLTTFTLSSCFLFGDVTTHPDGRIIIDAIEEEGYRAVSLSQGGLIDLGGMIFLPEAGR